MEGTYSSAILLHGMGQLVVLGLASAEETLLAHVEIKAFQATVSGNTQKVSLLNPFMRNQTSKSSLKNWAQVRLDVVDIRHRIKTHASEVHCRVDITFSC